MERRASLKNVRIIYELIEEYIQYIPAQYIPAVRYSDRGIPGSEFTNKLRGHYGSLRILTELEILNSAQ